MTKDNMFRTSDTDNKKLITDGKPPPQDEASVANSPEPNALWQSLAQRTDGVQTKLTVGRSEDAAEQEADSVAAQVMQASAIPVADTASEVVQRKCECGGQCEKCANRSAVSRSAAPAESESTSAPAIVQEALRSPAQALDASTRGFMESRLGEDFSGVRVHTGGAAAKAAEALNARAYTVGEDVVFGSGEYAPTTTEGKTLVAHELTHVRQQRRGNSEGHNSPVIRRDDGKKTAKVIPATIDNVDELYGPLTEDLAKQAFTAYGGALVGNESALIGAFTAAGLSGWTGLAVIKQESSFANKDANADIDERNIANPFSVHFNKTLGKWPKGCGKNLLLMPEAGKSYTPTDPKKKDCAAKDFRLPTFTESATASAKTLAKLAKAEGGIDAYREEGGYKKDLNSMLNDILRKIKAKRK
jgi:hypothetical protein